MKWFAAFAFIVWMLITVFFVVSIIGLFMVLKYNGTYDYKYGKEYRTNWMQLGFDIWEFIIK